MSMHTSRDRWPRSRGWGRGGSLERNVKCMHLMCTEITSLVLFEMWLYHLQLSSKKVRNELFSFGIPLYCALWNTDEILKERRHFILSFPFDKDTLLTDYGRQGVKTGVEISLQSLELRCRRLLFSKDLNFIRRRWTTFDSSWVVIPFKPVSDLQRINVIFPINPLWEVSLAFFQGNPFKMPRLHQKTFQRVSRP